MSDAARTLLAVLRASGVELDASGGRLRYRSKSPIDPRLRDAITRLKPELIALLNAPDAPLDLRLVLLFEAARHQHPEFRILGTDDVIQAGDIPWRRFIAAAPVEQIAAVLLELDDRYAALPAYHGGDGQLPPRAAKGAEGGKGT